MTDTTTRYSAVIQDEPARRIDPQQVWAQIGKWALIRIGAKDLMYSDTYVQFDVTAGRAKRRVIITLAPVDTYSVEIGAVQRRTYAWKSGEVVRDVYADSLATVLEGMYERAFDR